MTNFKEKLREEATSIIENPVELTEADLKEWHFWSSKDTKEREIDADIRYTKITELEKYLYNMLFTVKSIADNSAYFKPKKFKDEVALNFTRELKEFERKVKAFADSVNATLYELNSQSAKYAPHGVEVKPARKSK